MSVVYVVLPLALLIAAVAVGAFAWAAKRGQFDDLETPAHRMLHDDDPIEQPDSKQSDSENPKTS
ncbi:MAG: cbb3-type cytochrome oxidase assembly protein CcoS [Planctomycetes bacterium]|nr:cbb3-type cytochrome oxidase assembly protein CcoS [Planctomycetota bacterium]MCP4770481.1 cbb3-type cytochrome oxidase assembly protein CcoS [Planctomycetota bacterium]MCP4859921.1 cbb3-type cytochrome oxidase assembly protein CcoS [Planctomycetota bacterium]